MTFMQFWSITNEILKARGQEPMLYGEARGYFQETYVMAAANRMAANRAALVSAGRIPATH